MSTTANSTDCGSSATRLFMSRDVRLLKERREVLRESVAYFSSNNQNERDSWVCQWFLTKLGVKFNITEIHPETDDPPDVRFGMPPSR